MAMPSRIDQRVKSGARVVDVLEYLRRTNRPARAIDIAEALKLPASSANDLLKTLADIGFLEFDETDKTYAPGLRAALFGRWVASAYPEASSIDELVRQLAVETGESIVLFRGQSHQVKVIALQPGADPTPSNIVEGVNLPVIGTAAGAAFLMTRTHDDLRAIANRTFRTQLGRNDIIAIADIVHAFRRRGYASSHRDDVIPGYWAIAMPLPVRVRSGTVVLGIGGPIERVRENADALATLARGRIAEHFR